MYEIVPFIVDLPMKIVSRIFHSYLSFPEGVMSHDVTAESGSGCLQFPLQALNVRVLSLLFLLLSLARSGLRPLSYGCWGKTGEASRQNGSTIPETLKHPK